MYVLQDILFLTLAKTCLLREYTSVFHCNMCVFCNVTCAVNTKTTLWFKDAHPYDVIICKKSDLKVYFFSWPNRAYLRKPWANSNTFFLSVYFGFISVLSYGPQVREDHRCSTSCDDCVLLSVSSVFVLRAFTGERRPQMFYFLGWLCHPLSLHFLA